MNNHRYLCGVPQSSCCGFLARVNKEFVRVHGSPQEAFKCMAAFLLKSGYKKVGSREFEAPDGGPIRVLTKKSHFGCSLRKGKAGGESAVVTHGSRFTFKGRLGPRGGFSR